LLEKRRPHPAWTARGADGFPLETYPAAAAATHGRRTRPGL